MQVRTLTEKIQTIFFSSGYKVTFKHFICSHKLMSRGEDLCTLRAYHYSEPAEHGTMANQQTQLYHKLLACGYRRHNHSYFTSLYSAEIRLAEWQKNTTVHNKQYFPRQKATQDRKPDQQSPTIWK